MSHPCIFKADQDSRFASEPFTGVPLEYEIEISMDGRGRCYDNIFVEVLWWSVKHERASISGSATRITRHEVPADSRHRRRNLWRAVNLGTGF